MFGRKKDKIVKEPKKKKGNSSVIKVEVAPELKIDESNLVEIKDEMILARLNQAVPEIARAVAAGAKVVSAAQLPAVKCVLPAGTSAVVKGAVKGVQTGETLLGGASLAFSVAALIVGQKFMADVSKRLQTLNESLQSISDFQNNEYRSRVDALICRLTGILSYRDEFFRNDGLRQRTLVSLDSLEGECIGLLGQANETIAGYTQKRYSDFNAYCTAVSTVQLWLDYQNKLLAALHYLCELKYALNLGAASKEYCTSAYQTYLASVLKAQKALKKWHNYHIDKLEIDTLSLKRKRKGADAVLHFVPSLVKKECKYRAVPEEVARRIEQQRLCEVTDYAEGAKGSFDDDVEIIVKDGKVYYLSA